MIQKPLDAVTKADIDALIANKVCECRTIEYKKELPGDSDEDKREFLADVSSFANAAGGDILYGVTATEGIPVAALGLSGNLDSAKLRMESIIRDGIEPRIQGIGLRIVEGFSGGCVLIVHMPKSWSAPHMVTFKRLSRFFSRTSAGKYQLDVTEIRSAFLMSESLSEKIKHFRNDRLARIVAGETPVPLRKGARLILHILPVVSFASDFSLDISIVAKHTINLKPMGDIGWNNRLNLDGVVTCSGGLSRADESLSYCQVFRSGQVESVYSGIVREDEGGRRFIASVHYEENIIMAVSKYLEVLKAIGVPCPLIIFISMVGVSGAFMWTSDTSTPDAVAIDRDTIILSDIPIEDYSLVGSEKDVAKTLRPNFDAVWNACGYERSMNFDTSGNWAPRK